MIDITARRSASAVELHNALVDHVTLRQFVGRQRLSTLCSVRHSLAYFDTLLLVNPKALEVSAKPGEVQSAHSIRTATSRYVARSSLREDVTPFAYP